MRQSQALVLLGIIAQNRIVIAGSLPRGVGPEFVKFYETKDTFTCIGHPSITIPASRINDNSCDCPDGTDEPGTAACALLDHLSPQQPLPGSLSGTTNTTNALPGFWCANKGHVGAYVPFMYVNDGVCDYDLCCDGSEEYGNVGGVKCENKCAEIGKEWRRVEKERKDNLERANKRRRTMVKESKELRRRVESKITSLTEEIKELEVKRDELKVKLDEVERQERFKVVKTEGPGKLGVLAGLAKTRVNELRDTLNKIVNDRHQLRAKVDELEGILAAFKEEYNPNFNDEGVKKAVRAWEDYAAKKAGETQEQINEDDILAVSKEDSEESGINWKEFEEDEATDTDILYSFEAYLPGPLRDFLHSKINLFRIWLIENGILADAGSERGESRLVKAAREAHDTVANEVNAKTRTLEEQQRDLEKDYGKDDIFRYLKGKCITTEAGEYEYELCWLDKTSQKSKKGGGKTTMGNFNRFDFDEADEEERHDGKGLGRGKRVVLRYENGQGCWNGPNRKTDVWLACAETEELWRVSELEKCVYKMEVGTPAVCEEVVEPGHTKDEL
ncbi:glucosidase 2 subunit beta [Hypoxylon trugodes]|uniref:glucosidase 2 subunit beta n=1 Tax=Hypoxylon trugodes TaxID=326681 RepID=UPI00219D4706|nr:glucosidase 2 subunit beta [Hypoxylon trugodes]KAI1388150.1 glucosidase 2 subunit beta [Hypoxylon trugodes]